MTEDFFYRRTRVARPCIRIFAGSDTVLLHMWYNQRRVRHDSAAQIFNVLYRKAPANLGVGTVYLRRCRPSYSDERIARHCYPPGDLLLPFGQFTLCRACGDGTACVAAEYLALRIGRGMGAHCAPLRKKKSSAVPLFGAVSSLRFSPCPRRAGELGPLRKRPHDTAAQSRFYKLSIEYIHVKRNRQNCTKCPLNKNEPARRFAALILGCVEGRGFH